MKTLTRTFLISSIICFLAFALTSNPINVIFQLILLAAGITLGEIYKKKEL
jgi:hypothetical protein